MAIKCTIHIFPRMLNERSQQEVTTREFYDIDLRELLEITDRSNDERLLVSPQWPADLLRRE